MSEELWVIAQNDYAIEVCAPGTTEEEARNRCKKLSSEFEAEQAKLGGWMERRTHYHMRSCPIVKVNK